MLILNPSFSVVVLYSVACAPGNLFHAACIALQLFAAGIVTVLLDELLAAGFGFCGGAKLFIATGACTSIFAGILAPYSAGAATAGPEGASEVLGSVWALFSLLASRPNKLKALQEALFYRGQGLPSLFNTAITIALAAGIAYSQVRFDGWGTLT